ncbi:MAG TPA: cyclase [Campylobacterales bacterium]|nr:cyclase [Campylobacterales bacterium]
MRKYLSYTLNRDTPTYGNRNRFQIIRNSDISKGDIANDSSISTTLHIGTHIDMPFHFYQDGQTVEDFDIDFWYFNNPLFLEIEPRDLIIYDEVVEQLEKLENIGQDILIIKTGICDIRDSEKFWRENYGFSPNLYDYLIKKFPEIRVIGFDSISISSFQNREEGREAHRRFLNPKRPILILEDMDLREVKILKRVQIVPLRVSNSDGLPCTVIAEW